MPGYHGRYLRVDPRLDRAGCVPLDESTLRQFIGGVGLGTWIVANETPKGVDPLGPDACLVFALSPLVGSPLTTSAKFAVVAIGPLTARVCDALCSSHFAIAAKRTGVDAIALSGAFDEPTVVFIDGTGVDTPRVETHPAGDLWGLSAAEAERRIRLEHGNAWQVAAIGPAGERLIPFATISHDGRHAGRGGLGAVMGSKKIKAIAVKGDRRTSLADPRRTVELARDLSTRSLGPATEKYRELGTVANLLAFNRFDALPTRNFQTGHFEGAERLAGHDLGPSPKVARKSCASCTIGCEHIYEVGPKKGARMEYESLFALGPLCGVDDPDAVLRAALACDDAGLDTISTGGTIAFVMECAERGWIDARVGASGRPLKFGDGESVLEAIADLLDRRGGRRMAGAREPEGRRINRPGLGRPGAARQGARNARLRPEGPARDGPRPGRRHPRGRPQPLRRLRGRLLRPGRPPRRGRRLRPRRDRDRGPRRLDRLPDPLQVPPRGLHRPLRRIRRHAPRP